MPQIRWGKLRVGCGGGEAGYNSGRPGPAEVKAAAGAVDVQDFAGKEKPRDDSGFQSACLNFFQINSAGRELGFVPAARAAYPERFRFKQMRQ